MDKNDYINSTDCPEFGSCGGCKYLDIPYEQELQIKKDEVVELLRGYLIGNTGKPLSEALNIVPSPSSSGYRNKMELSFGDDGPGGTLALGIRKRGRFYEVAIPSKCALIPDDFKAITMATLEHFRETGETFYHRKRHTGSLRYLVLRRGEFTGELLVNLVTTSALSDLDDKWSDKICGLSLQGKIAGILHTVSDSKSDAVVPEDVRLLYGRSHFYEKICSLTFEVSAFSFMQTNSAGAELLYNTVREYAAGDNGEEKVGRVYDLYCGTGTIAQILAPLAEEVIGVELVPEAIEAAKKSAEANRLHNCRFIAGDVLKVMIDKKGEQPDVLVLDPPRDGIHPKAIGPLVALNAPKVVYVSCKPKSLARDLPVFYDAGYRIEGLRLHDMFPRTGHVEAVVLLCRGDT